MGYPTRAIADVNWTREEYDRQRSHQTIGGRAARQAGRGQALVDTVPNPERQAAEVLPDDAIARSRIGRYELLRFLGSGGMGTVYAARDPRLGRRVAVKLMSSADPAFVARFLLEARATARCNHENIVVIHEVGEEGGFPFMVLEYIEGKTLAEDLESGPLSPGRALDYLVPVVRALEHAHAAGIVHRDLKPENVMLTDAGAVKVLDFGIAQAFAGAEPVAKQSLASRLHDEPLTDAPSGRLTGVGRTVGTPPYMSPEQLRAEEVDGRADVWAVGVLAFLMLAGEHPLGEGKSRGHYMDLGRRFNGGLRSLKDSAADVPAPLADIVDRCLRLDREERFASAADLRDALEALTTTPRASIGADECPYPGLESFGRAESGRFFGRGGDVRRVAAKIRDLPLVALVGPSGVGKSSLLRAGACPALARAGEEWDVVEVRPGRDGLARLADVVDDLGCAADDAPTADRLRAEPGLLGKCLRERAQKTGASVLLSVDQLEELYTLTAAPEDRRTFTACLRAAADDPASPVRVVVTMRSDFLDRANEDPAFLDSITRGLVFVAPMDRVGLREALVRPALLAGYSFETESLVDEMLDQLEAAASPLPLLQFAANKLWDGRDQEKQILTEQSYRDMGGLAGALATHADQVLLELSPEAQADVRRMFLRLVTTERTRAVVELAELLEASRDAARARDLIDHLVAGRLLVVRTEGDAPTVEIVHESLVTRWPRLSHWLAEANDDLRFVDQLRTTARQWDQRARPVGLLWRESALDEARLWRRRNPDRQLPAIEAQYLDAVFELDASARHRRRRTRLAVFLGLAAVAIGSLVALGVIGRAQYRARVAAEDARDQAERALAAQERAAVARDRAIRERENALRERSEREKAENTARSASARVEQTREDLRRTNEQLAAALAEQRVAAERAQKARREAEREAQRAGAAEDKLRARGLALERLLREKEQRVKELESQRRKISTELR